MRSIKFRAWLRNEAYPDGHMYYAGSEGSHEASSGFYLNLDGDLVESFEYAGDNACKLAWARISNTIVDIMQYSGVNDINGVEIYEGDIIRNKFGIFNVVYSDASFRLRFISGSNIYYTEKLRDFRDYPNSPFTVMYNIYEEVNK